MWQTLPADLNQLLHFVDNVLDCDCDARRYSSKIFVHIGAGGASSHCPLWSLLAREPQTRSDSKRYRWSVFGAEPIASLAAQTEQAYRSCANVDGASIAKEAIDVECGKRAIYSLLSLLQESDARKDGPPLFSPLPPWSNYLSTFYADQNALFGVSLDSEMAEKIASERQSTVVQTLSMQAFIDREKIERIDVLRINTQGHDWSVLQQLDLNAANRRPFCISCHVGRLQPADRENLYRYLRIAGFVWRLYGEDIVAVDSRIVWQYWESKSAQTSARSTCLDLCEETVCRNGGACRLVRLTPHNLRLFVTEGLPTAIGNLTQIAQRADYIRARVVCAHGGAWLDSDTVVVRSLDPLWQRLCTERLELLGFNTSGIWQGNHLFNGFFMAPHHSRFMSAFFDQLLMQVASTERDASLPERNWVLFGAECMSTVSCAHCLYPSVALLNESGDLLGRTDVEYQFDEFVDGNRFDHLLKDERIRIIPLFHTKNKMHGISRDNLQCQDGNQSTLVKFMRLALSL